MFALGRTEEAGVRFARLLEIRRDQDEPSAVVKSRRKSSPPGAVASGSAGVIAFEQVGPRYRLAASTNVRRLFTLDGASVLALAQWSPQDFGQARMAAVGGQLAAARRGNDEEGWLARRRQAREKTPGDIAALWDDYYLGLIRLEPRETYQAALALARASGRDPGADFSLLQAFSRREMAPGPVARGALPDASSSGPPLPAGELDLIPRRLPLRRPVRPGAGLWGVGGPP